MSCFIYTEEGSSVWAHTLTKSTRGNGPMTQEHPSSQWTTPKLQSSHTPLHLTIASKLISGFWTLCLRSTNLLQLRSIWSGTLPVGILSLPSPYYSSDWNWKSPMGYSWCTLLWISIPNCSLLVYCIASKTSSSPIPTSRSVLDHTSKSMSLRLIISFPRSLLPLRCSNSSLWPGST